MSDLTLQERFEEFHAANPGVYEELRRLALNLVDHGVTRFGIATVYEELRYRGLETHGDAYKLNNDWRAEYARLLMGQEPRLAGVFLVRKQRARRRMPGAPEYAFEPDTGQGVLAA